MSNYPPPPQPDQQHYNPAYPTQSPLQTFQDDGIPDPRDQQDRLAFAEQLAQASYPKIEHEGLDPNTSIQIEERLEQLQQQQNLESLNQHLDQEQAHHDQDPNQFDPSTSLLHPDEQNHAPSKLYRLRKACDSCSIRKVKCDESGPPCKACASLDIPCTFERPSRRRGPPNRHAEAVKRRRIEEPEIINTVQPKVASPTHAARGLAALSAHPAIPSNQLSVETILPIEIVDLIVNDYFTFIHPYYPFPHEPRFREQWETREDAHNRPFLALLSSVVAVVIAVCPSKLKTYLEAHRTSKNYANHLDLINNCFATCATARGLGFLDNQNINIYDAATSFLLGLSALHSSRWKTSRLLFGECITIIKSIGLHKSKYSTYNALGKVPGLVGYSNIDHEGSKDEILDYITVQVGRRLFWSTFIMTRTLAQFGQCWSDLSMSSSSTSQPYPPLPAEVEDFCIFPQQIESQPDGLVSIITAFKCVARIHTAYQATTVLQTLLNSGHEVWDQQKIIYQDSLSGVKNVVVQLPTELRLFAGDVNEDSDALFDAQLAVFQGKVEVYIQTPFPANPYGQTPETRRAIQITIQKANIHLTALSCRLYIISSFWKAYSNHHHSSNTDNNLSKMKYQAVIADDVPPSETENDNIMSKLETLLPLIQSEQNESIYPQTVLEGVEAEMLTERANIVRDVAIVLKFIDLFMLDFVGYDFVSHQTSTLFIFIYSNLSV